jgi:NAD(P)-dependent dehydrogenase (short-subunit alcohol dehydrogenase family)
LTPEAQKLVDCSNISSNGRVLFKRTDVTIWRELEDLFAFAEREIGSPDIVCPGAGKS